MKIKLVQSGGIGGRKMSATADHKLTKEEWDELVAASKKTNSPSRSIKDGFNYVLQNGEDENSRTVIDIRSIPEKYERLFKKLFDRLKVEG